MERRTALKYLFVVAGGAAVLPACLHQQSKASILLKNMAITYEQEKMLAVFAETITPASATPGAKDTYAHLFARRMVDDCFDKKKQQAFLKGMKEVDDMTRKEGNTPFAKSTAAQKTKTLAALEAKKAPTNALAFYGMMKSLTIQGYLTSRPILGDVFHYELVPGRYNGAVPVKTVFHQA